MTNEEDRRKHSIRRRNVIVKEMVEKKVFSEKKHLNTKEDKKITLKNYEEFCDD